MASKYGAPFVSKLFLVTGETERNIDLILRPKSQNIDPIFWDKNQLDSLPENRLDSLPKTDSIFDKNQLDSLPKIRLDFRQKSTRFFDKNHLRSIIKRCGQHSPTSTFSEQPVLALYSVSRRTRTSALRRMATLCEVEVSR